MGEAGDVACTASAWAGLGYRRREPERTLLHATVRAHLKTFLAETEQRGDGAGLPGFVISEFERYLACGILAHGFARVRCSSCGNEMLVAFSCKGRGFCPSCTTRRMQGTATHLLDRVLPHVPMRQWVLSLPRWARFLLARDPQLITRALDIALRAIFSLQRRRARRTGASGADGRGHLRSTIRRRPQPQRALSLRDSRRRVRPRWGSDKLSRSARTL